MKFDGAYRTSRFAIEKGLGKPTDKVFMQNGVSKAVFKACALLCGQCGGIMKFILSILMQIVWTPFAL